MKTIPTELTGTISHGTFRKQDLVPAFFGFINHFIAIGGELDADDPYHTYKDEVETLCSKRDDDVAWTYESVTHLIYEDLWQTMENISPKGYSFQSHEGDGSDFGFWPFCQAEHGDNCDDCPFRETQTCTEISGL